MLQVCFQDATLLQIIPINYIIFFPLFSLYKYPIIYFRLVGLFDFLGLSSRVLPLASRASQRVHFGFRPATKLNKERVDY